MHRTQRKPSHNRQLDQHPPASTPARSPPPQLSARKKYTPFQQEQRRRNGARRDGQPRDGERYDKPRRDGASCATRGAFRDELQLMRSRGMRVRTRTARAPLGRAPRRSQGRPVGTATAPEGGRFGSI